MRLLQPTQLASLPLKNRMAMAPMTRSRADEQGVVNPLTAKYYAQRASLGLIITEGVNISAQALGSPHTPGLFTPEQVAAWKTVTDAVHAAGGRIVAQLWHTGRVGHSSVRGGELPVAPSAIAIEGQKHFTPSGPHDYETPRALTTEEVRAVVNDYHTAAHNARLAGFDGVELHAAFGYLPNQFLVDGANTRTDEYGGSIENRSRFVLEVMRELAAEWPQGVVGIKLSPSIPFNGMIDTDPKAVFTYLISELDKLPISYLQLMNPLFPLDAFPHWPSDMVGTFAGLFHRTVMMNGGYTAESAEAVLNDKRVQMVSFGALTLANPDLPARFEKGAALNAPDRSTFYGGQGEKGYTDYPFLETV